MGACTNAPTRDFPLFNKHFADSGRFYRTKSAKSLEADLDALVSAYNPEFLFFVSETFLAMKKGFLEEFCDVYSKYKIPFWMNTRPETITEDNISKLKAVCLERSAPGWNAVTRTIG